MPAFFIIVLVGALVGYFAIRVIRKNRYFASEHFQILKTQIAYVVAEHNAIVDYVGEIREQGSFELGSSPTGQYAYLASFDNVSKWNYRRDRNVAQYAPHVHNASLQIVRNASTDPIKYLMKYFSINADRQTLADVQRVADNISRLEQAVANAKNREVSITATIDPPCSFLSIMPPNFGVKLASIYRQL